MAVKVTVEADQLFVWLKLNFFRCRLFAVVSNVEVIDDISIGIQEVDIKDELVSVGCPDTLHRLVFFLKLESFRLSKARRLRMVYWGVKAVRELKLNLAEYITFRFKAYFINKKVMRKRLEYFLSRPLKVNLIFVSSKTPRR